MKDHATELWGIIYTVKYKFKMYFWGAGFKSLQRWKFNDEDIDLGSLELCAEWQKLLRFGILSNELDWSSNCSTAFLTYSLKYNQQDATLYNILYYCQCSSCFRRFLRPSSGAQKLYTQHWVCARLAVCTVFELLMMGGKTAQNM